MAGIGSSLLRDGGAGPHAVLQAEQRLRACSGIVFKQLGAGGFDLLYELDGFDRAILVDCGGTGGIPGDIREVVVDGKDGEAAAGDRRLAECHGVDLMTVLALGKQCGHRMPEQVVMIGICGEDSLSFGTMPTPRVADALGRVVDLIEDKVLSWNNNNQARSR